MRVHTLIDAVQQRILSQRLLNRVMTPEEAARSFKTGMTISTSGFGTGYPRLIPQALAKLGEAKEMTLINAAARGVKHIGALIESGCLKKFIGFQWSEIGRNAINAGELEFIDCHLSQISSKIQRGHFGKIDVAIIECCKIYEDGSFVPGVSGGIVETLVDCSDKIFLELNLAIPESLEGIHDLHVPSGTSFSSPTERAGLTYCKCNSEKIAGIVINEEIDTDLVFPEVKPLHKEIANQVVRLLKNEIAKGAIPEEFTFQCGTGLVINCVLIEMMKMGFKNLKMYTEVLGEQALLGLLDGTISEASTTAMDITPSGFSTLYDYIEKLKERVVIRSLDLSNGSAQILPMELVSLNGVLEADIYGNVNSSHAYGSHMVNGLGGSNDFCRNAKISIFSTASTSKGGAISRIVPMVSHVDSTEHDTDFIVTEWGFADLRGKSPKERVSLIIENCAHPDYREMLWDYYNGAVEKCGPCQTPHNLPLALSWHQRFLDTGSMK
jgi:succinyl-CoA:acetate CoA-transferase